MKHLIELRTRCGAKQHMFWPSPLPDHVRIVLKQEFSTRVLFASGYALAPLVAHVRTFERIDDAVYLETNPS